MAKFQLEASNCIYFEAIVILIFAITSLNNFASCNDLSRDLH
jgi:hypothetical protein